MAELDEDDKDDDAIFSIGQVTTAEGSITGEQERLFKRRFPGVFHFKKYSCWNILTIAQAPPF